MASGDLCYKKSGTKQLAYKKGTNPASKGLLIYKKFARLTMVKIEITLDPRTYTCETYNTVHEMGFSDTISASLFPAPVKGFISTDLSPTIGDVQHNLITVLIAPDNENAHTGTVDFQLVCQGSKCTGWAESKNKPPKIKITATTTNKRGETATATLDVMANEWPNDNKPAIKCHLAATVEDGTVKSMSLTEK